MADMTPDQFFDALDELFGTDDGYVNHLERIKKLKVFKEDVIDATQCDNDLKDHQYIDYIEEMERSYDPELDEEREELIEYCKQEGREEKEKEYEELAFEIGGKFQANNPYLMKDEVVVMKSEIKELNKQIDLQVHWKENEKTKRIKLEREMEELKEQVKTLQYQLKDIEPEYEVMKESWIAPEDVNHIQDDYVKAMDELKSKTVKQISKLYQENKQLKKDIARVQKERNYLGDYCGGATSDEDN